ncbi:hypothetical protein CEQ90_14955 [Lewinellaceae bacterium SD302]|nr:hypothetical protein CEQ90_14955 [Lewinellaceae bacterium SD302]
MVKQEDQVVLHAKSGIGKSSLIKAGLLPRIRKDRSLEPVEFRLYASSSAKSRDPLSTTKEVLFANLAGGTNPDTPLDKLLPNDRSLWNQLKEIQLDRIAKDAEKAYADPPLLLIFDQFEELFTYSRQDQLAFRSQIAEAISGRMPQRYWDILSLYEGQEGPVSAEEKRLLMRPMRIKVLFAIREDRIHLLGELSDYLPAISKNWFKLDHLNAEEATRAIEAPARQPGEFATAPFTYAGDLRNNIISYLSGDYEGIESAQLQVICDAIDRKMQHDDERTATVEKIGDLENITANYYWEKIDEIKDPEQQMAARKLIEEQLIFEEAERRLTLFEGQIIDSGVSKDTLDTLIDTYLLRAEPDLRGGYNYEISHDSLIKPILEAKRERFVLERVIAQEEKEKVHAERLAKEIAENKKSRRLNIILTALLALATLTTTTSIYYYYQVDRERRRTRELLDISENFREKVEKSTENNRTSLRNSIRLHLDNAGVYLDSNDGELAKEEVGKASRAAAKLQTTDYDTEINLLRLQIDAIKE